MRTTWKHIFQVLYMPILITTYQALPPMKAVATRNGDGFVLNGTKTFITNGPHADIFLVYAREAQEDSIQAFIVEREFPGVSTSAPFEKMGMKSSPTGQVFFDDARLPQENLLGLGVRDRHHVRKSLAAERVGIVALSYGIAERCFEIARDYAKQRVQGGQVTLPAGTTVRLSSDIIIISDGNLVINGRLLAVATRPIGITPMSSGSGIRRPRVPLQ